MRTLNSAHLLVSFLMIPILLAFLSCKQQQESTTTIADAEMAGSETMQPSEDPVQRGAYLVSVIGCADCHTPKKMTEQGPVPDMDKYMMGFDGSRPMAAVPDGVPIGPWVLFNGELTAAVGPWGTSFAGNITPHETGIGTWTFEQFRKVMKEGKYKGMDQGRPIMPPMPVEAYKNFTDEDLQAIFAYLKSIEPIENVVPGYQPPAGS